MAVDTNKFFQDFVSDSSDFIVELHKKENYKGIFLKFKI